MAKQIRNPKNSVFNSVQNLDTVFSIKFSILLALLISFVLPILLLLPLIIVHALGLQLSSVGITADNFGGFVLVVQAIALIISLVIIARKLNQANTGWASVGLKKFRVFQATRYVVGYYVIMIALVVSLVAILSAVGTGLPENPDAQGGGGLVLNLFGGFGLAFVASVILAPVIEEIVFRGILFPAIAKRYGLLAGVLGSSVVFMLVHLNPVVMVSALPLGVYLAIMYKRTNSIYPGMILHASWNLIVLLSTQAAAHS